MFDYKKYYDQVFEFTTIETAIRRKNASKNKYEERANKIIKSYNDIIELTREYFSGNDQSLKTSIRTKLVDLRDRLNTNLSILNRSDIYIPKDLTEKVKYYPLIEEKKNLTMSNAENYTYIGNISKIISFKYSGDSNALNSFISAIELADTATTDEQQPILVKFIKTKLEGRALEALPENVENATQLIHALKSKIKPESSKIVLGRFLALRAERNSLQKFQETADELSNSLRRAYISEGMSQTLAEKTTIDKTVEMCRLSAKTNLVKSVLASTQFSEPKEVIAKLITESNIENTETQILYYRGTNNQRGRFSSFRGNRNDQFNQNWRGRRNRNSNFNNNNNNSYNRNRNFQSNYRGRGRNNFNNRGNGQSNSRNTDTQNNTRYMRLIEEENDETPTTQRSINNTVSMQARRM